MIFALNHGNAQGESRYAHDGVHAPEPGAVKSAPEPELVDHVEARPTSEDHGPAGAPDEAPLDGLERSIGLGSQCAAAYGWQYDQCDQRDAPDRNHDGEDVQRGCDRQCTHELSS